MTTHYGKGTAQRTCAAADRTGHAMLHTLYQQSLKHEARVLHRVFRDRPDHGGRRLPRRPRARHVPTARCTASARTTSILATGGYGRAYFSCTSAHTCTGDGGGMVLRAGLPLQDMEFVQFHPTGIYGAGCLITEGVRGEGGYLTNSRGRALHGALRAERQGPGVARRRQPRDDDRDPRRSRRRRAQGPHPPAPRAPGRRRDPRAPAGHRRDGAHLRRRRRHQGADSGAADRALQHGRHPVQLPRRSGDAEATAIPTRSCRA